ncbi:hypothetical protein OF83DRAFT_84019 [Amylostereum chailletii]|nr:hypothetical protein OF83DRAFT_84019 [Amylostereum chailletii]
MIHAPRLVRVLPISLIFLSAWAWYITFDHSTPSFDIQHLSQHSDAEQRVFRDEAPLTPPPPPISKYNISELWFPVTETHRLDGHPRWEAENNAALSSLLICMQKNDCEPNQDKVVILSSFHFKGAVNGWTAGEDVWARSTIIALRNLGYTILYAASKDHTIRLHQMIPSLVIAIFAEQAMLDECFDDEIECIKSIHNPYGLPIWKMLAFFWWQPPTGPLGGMWTLSPEPYEMQGMGPSLYLGYSIEHSCANIPFVPHHKRPERAYILTKRLRYLAESKDRAWPPEYFATASREIGVELMLGTQEESVMGEDGEVFRPQDSLGETLNLVQEMPMNQFLTELSKSRVLIGVGRPSTCVSSTSPSLRPFTPFLSSPTPYEALCLGVPFINPILSWDPKRPTDRSLWRSQHSTLKSLDPPYVYNVFINDKQGFVKAIKSALNNPIDSFVPEHMRMKSIESRLQHILERDYYTAAKHALERRKLGQEEGPYFTL